MFVRRRAKSGNESAGRPGWGTLRPGGGVFAGGVPRSVAGSLSTVGVGLVLLGLTLAVLLALALVAVRRNPEPPLPVLGTVPDFVLTNQSGIAVTRADLRGHPWVADIIFTRCAGPCPILTRRMKMLQDALPADRPVRLVTLTTDPAYDTPEVLRRYGEKFGADFRRWWFLTGAPEQIARLAVDGLKLTALEIPEEQRSHPAELFIHSTTFVLVDGQGRLRASFETVGEDVDFQTVQRRILRAIRRLEREPAGSQS
ncbi:SCO family protein [Limisphaera sp. 4302-co]|uniref:SCO family protein n=1 Tax=Limisphaera sp. 4302-co TaxID=3400417 RepID=UPI003C17BE9F